MDKMSTELSRSIWMLWYLTNLIGTANEPKDGDCIMWLLVQPSPNEYKWAFVDLLSYLNVIQFIELVNCIKHFDITSL